MPKILLYFSIFLILSGCATKPIPEPEPEIVVEPEVYIPLSQQIIEADRWRKALRKQPYEEQITEANSVYTNPKTREILKEQALYVSAVRKGKNAPELRELLTQEYNIADDTTKKKMEYFFAREAKFIPNDILKEIVTTISKEQESIFPYNALVWIAAKKNLLQQTATINRLNASTKFADKALFDNIIPFGGNVETKAINPDPTFYPICVSMVLPTSAKGSLATITGEISKGAKAAQKVLGESGVNVVLNIIDSQKNNWIEKVNELPEECVIIGGPLLSTNLEEAYKNHLFEEKAFFAFASRLSSENYREGENIWRFFTSLEDQVRPTLAFLKEDLKITQLGSFYPEEPYGELMNTAFKKVAAENGMTVKEFAYSTDPKEQKKRSTNMATLLGSRKHPNPKIKLPRVTAPVKAVFLPDTWNNMELFTSLVHFQGGVKLPIIGTSFWEKGLNGVDKLSDESLNYLTLSLFPAEWNTNSMNYGALHIKKKIQTSKTAKVEDWNVLGYDFIQMAANLYYDISATDNKLNPDEINAKLHNLEDIAWAGAPFKWDENGHVTRELFVFQVDEKQIMKPLDKREFNRELKKK